MASYNKRETTPSSNGNKRSSSARKNRTPETDDTKQRKITEYFVKKSAVKDNAGSASPIPAQASPSREYDTLEKFWQAIYERDEGALESLISSIDLRNRIQAFSVDEKQKFLLETIDAYLKEDTLGKWEISQQGKLISSFTSRDAALGSPRAEAQQTKKTKICNYLLQVIFFCDSNLRTANISEYYEKKIAEHKSYTTHFYSDNSDTEDNRSLSDPPTNERQRYYKKIRELQKTKGFWQKTRRTTRLNAGLADKLNAIKNASTSAQIKKDVIEDLGKTVKTRLESRGTLDNPTTETKFVAEFRGINYMRDRWSLAARRTHYRLNEHGSPQFSEAALKELSFDFYTELDNLRNRFTEIELVNNLSKISAIIQERYTALRKTGLFIGETVSPSTKGPYLFNNIADSMQHEFSNGISQHLLRIHERLREKKEYWEKFFINSFSYAIATGNRPYHSLLYSVGLKEYYHYNFDLRYDQNGRLVNSHAGKIYIILYKKEDFIKELSVNRVVQQHYRGQVPIGLRIMPELETSFIGKIPGENIVHQHEIKFPSFEGDFLDIFEIKYGFDEKLYGLFKWLICKTPILSPEREAAITLLKEWLCAYLEVLLLHMAQEKAKEQGGSLVYVNYANEESQTPEKNPKASGDPNALVREQLNLFEAVRRELAKEKITDPEELKKKLEDIKFVDKISPGLERQQKMKLLKQNQNFFVMPETTSVVAQPNNLTVPSHQYNDVEMNALLRRYLPHAEIWSAQSPLVRGPLSVPLQKEFFNITRLAIDKVNNENTISVIPINITQQFISADMLSSDVAGTHWIGLLIRKEGRYNTVIELMDPANRNRDQSGCLCEYSGDNPILMLLKTLNIFNCYYKIFSTEQQAGDLDCGPWTIDNLVRRARGDALGNNREITRADLRKAQNEAYQLSISENRR